jgi:ADP-heptose:LPS heptosyltransferase
LGFHRADTKELNWIFNNQHIEACGEAISKLDHYLKFAEYLRITPKPLEWQIALTPQDKLAVRQHLAEIHGDFAVLFVGSRWQSKDWFPEQAAACANELNSRYRWPVVLLGAGQQTEVAGQITNTATGTVVNLVGRTSLREAAGIISNALICVGPDTGLMHVAAAMGTPVISLWGATDAQRTGPYGFDDLVIRGQADCAPCYRKNCSIGKICMRSIGNEMIMNKVETALSRRFASQSVSAKVG